MYYMALRQRGVNKITTSCKNVNLEGGIYDLTLAERFVGTGNLDSYAESLRTYARLYIIGASYWDQDWSQARDFFDQVMAAYPNMSDSSCLTATNRWVLSSLKEADEKIAAGDYCSAVKSFKKAFKISDPYNATAYATATAVDDLCDGNSGSSSGGSNKKKTQTSSETTPGGNPTP
jgi:hypothetical protein